MSDLKKETLLPNNPEELISGTFDPDGEEYTLTGALNYIECFEEYIDEDASEAFGKATFQNDERGHIVYETDYETTGKGYYTGSGMFKIIKTSVDNEYIIEGIVSCNCKNCSDHVYTKKVNTWDDLGDAVCGISDDLWENAMDQ